MKMFVARRTDTNGAETKKALAKRKRKRLASGSYTTIKKRMREENGSEWELVHYLIKPDVPTMIQVIENLAKLEAEWIQTWSVSDTGRLKQVS